MESILIKGMYCIEGCSDRSEWKFQGYGGKTVGDSL